jgi:hypothetical protein
VPFSFEILSAEVRLLKDNDKSQESEDGGRNQAITGYMTGSYIRDLTPNSRNEVKIMISSPLQQ